MAGLRKGHCYNKIERPYTRRSKFKKKGFIKAVPTIKVVRYSAGEPKKNFEYRVCLYTKSDVQIRHNAIESARQIINRHLNQRIGNANYYFQINMYPHHILRENKMLGGAHADRLQSGMAHSFGKAIGLAAQAKKGKVLFSVRVNADKIGVVTECLKKAVTRIPCKCGVLTERVA